MHEKYHGILARQPATTPPLKHNYYYNYYSPIVKKEHHIETIQDICTTCTVYKC